MRRDVTELKKLVHEIMTERETGHPMSHSVDSSSHFLQTPTIDVISDVPMVVPQVQQYPQVSQIQPINKVSSITPVSNNPVKSADSSDYQDTEVYVEENLSLDDVEKEMIKKALERHNGKRKNAASDLKISERTLYRKIKEYGLE